MKGSHVYKSPMKDQQQTAVEHLAHALVFVRLARETDYPELRRQHLDEAERLIEYAKGIMEGPHGETQA